MEAGLPRTGVYGAEQPPPNSEAPSPERCFYHACTASHVQQRRRKQYGTQGNLLLNEELKAPMIQANHDFCHLS